MRIRSAWSNIVQNWSQLVLPVALVFVFGRMVGDARQGRALLIAMAILFAGALIVFYWCEARGQPDFYRPWRRSLPWERGRKGLALWASWVGALRASDNRHGHRRRERHPKSMTPLSGMAALFNLLLGCIPPGGIGTGLYSLLLLVFITAFIGALMIGRTPEYLGKKISTREMQFALFALLLSPALILVLRGRLVRC